MGTLEIIRVFVALRNHEEGCKVLGVRDGLDAAKQICQEDQSGLKNAVRLEWYTAFDHDDTEIVMADSEGGVYEIYTTGYVTG